MLGNAESAQNGPSGLRRKHSEVLNLSQLPVDWAEQRLDLVRMLVITGMSSQAFLEPIKREGSYTKYLPVTHTVGSKETPLNSSKLCIPGFHTARHSTTEHKNAPFCVCVHVSQWKTATPVSQAYLEPILSLLKFPQEPNSSQSYLANLIFSDRMPAEPGSPYLQCSCRCSVLLEYLLSLQLLGRSFTFHFFQVQLMKISEQSPRW